MKKRILSLLLAVCTAVSLLAVPAAAADTVNFADISDRDTAMAVESLRLMGVLDGYGDGSFRPYATLTRAQFCKMAVYVMDGSDELGRYSTVTIFPDVKPSHWAASYINMAAKGKGIIAGYADGKFHPDQTVTVGQAVTILLRLLGYKDENIGGIWPQSYVAQAATIGLTDGVSTDGYAALTRGQAARLFLNLLRADMAEGGTYLSSIGTPVVNTMLVSSNATGPDGRGNALQTADGSVYTLASGKSSNGMLNGRKGTLVLEKNSQRVLTFVPDAAGSSRTITLASKTATQIVDSNGVRYAVTSGTKAYYSGSETTWGDVYAWLHAGTSVTLYLDSAGGVEYIFVGGSGNATAAVIVYEDRSGAGFDSLTGGITNYAIYKNGAPAGLGDLRKYDVAVYDSASNAIRVCDTRVTVYYESCSPNPKEPSQITALGHTFDVLPTAMDSLSKFKPGDQMTLLLTDGGQVAGAVEASGNTARGNAVGIVRSDGTVQMLCGTAKISISSSEADQYKGQLVRISSGKKDSVTLSRLSGGAGGDLDVSAKKLGSRNLADNVMIFQNGEDISLGQLTSGKISSNNILYARTNWAGDVDLIVLGSAAGSTVYYGRAVVRRDESVQITDENGKEPGESGYKPTDASGRTTLEVVYGNGKSVGPYVTGYAVNTGDYVAVTVNSSKDGFSSLNFLTQVRNVSNSAWSGPNAVTVGGRTYSVADDVPCYNKNGNSWMSVDAAHAYADTCTIYIADGAVRVIEVG